MGVSTDANLFYGVEIVDGDGDWYGDEPTGAWWTERSSDDDACEVDLMDAFENITDVPELDGVGIDWHCHVDWSVWVLHIYSATAWRGSPRCLDLAELEKRRIEENWDARFATALAWLGITPKAKPGWILASSSDH